MNKKIVFGLIAAFTAADVYADPVLLPDGNYWQQPADFLNVGWNEVEQVCPVINNGACSGFLNGIDLTGWTFASNSEVRQAIDSLSSETIALDFSTVGIVDSEFGPATLSLFTKTGSYGLPYDGDYVSGYVRDVGGTNRTYSIGIGDRFSATLGDIVQNTVESFISKSPIKGAWFFSSDAATPALLCDGFYPPMANYPVKVRKNRVFPLKLELFDSDGYELTDADLTEPPVVQVLFSAGGTTTAVDVTEDVLSSGQGSDGNQFVYTDEGLWQFNLKSKNHSASGTYEITALSGDDSEYTIDPLCVTSFVVE